MCLKVVEHVSGVKDYFAWKPALWNQFSSFYQEYFGVGNTVGEPFGKRGKARNYFELLVSKSV